MRKTAMKVMGKITMKKIIFCLIAASFVLGACKPKTNSDSNTDSNSITAGFPKTMYVNAKAGLRMRSEPSVDSIKIGNYSYGEQIQVLERSNTPITIDGITDYWYKTKVDITFEGKSYKHSWVFGGFLTGSAPAVPAGVELKKLQLRNGVYYLNNVPYTGVANKPKDPPDCWECMEEKWEMKDGRFHGKYEATGPGVGVVGTYKEGKKHGKWQDFDHDLSVIGNYKDDKKQGEWKYSSDTGGVYKIETYKDDVKIKEWEKN